MVSGHPPVESSGRIGRRTPSHGRPARRGCAPAPSAARRCRPGSSAAGAPPPWPTSRGPARDRLAQDERVARDLPRLRQHLAAGKVTGGGGRAGVRGRHGGRFLCAAAGAARARVRRIASYFTPLRVGAQPGSPRNSRRLSPLPRPSPLVQPGPARRAEARSRRRTPRARRHRRRTRAPSRACRAPRPRPRRAAAAPRSPRLPVRRTGRPPREHPHDQVAGLNAPMVRPSRVRTGSTVAPVSATVRLRGRRSCPPRARRGCGPYGPHRLTPVQNGVFLPADPASSCNLLHESKYGLSDQGREGAPLDLALDRGLPDVALDTQLHEHRLDH